MTAKLRSFVCALVLCVGALATRSSAADDPRGTASPYGVLDFLQWDHDWSRHHYDLEKVQQAATLMAEAGVGIVRFDFLWQDVEPEKDRFDFEKYDRILDALDQKGIKVLAILEYHPSWRGGEWNAAPVPQDYVDYARATVAHFKGRVRYWEIWNEPDSKTYWQPQDQMVRYAALLKAVYPAIKAEDPTALVVLGGMTESGPFAVRRIYQQIGKDYFDVVNIHPFVDPLKPNALQRLKGIYFSLSRIMKEFGDENKPIWFTELGCPGVETPDSDNAWWHGTSPTEAEQATWVTAIYTNALQWKGVEKIFWAFFRDTDDFFHNGVDSFGLLREDFSKKPSFEAYKRAATARSSAVPPIEDKDQLRR